MARATDVQYGFGECMGFVFGFGGTLNKRCPTVLCVCVRVTGEG